MSTEDPTSGEERPRASRPIADAPEPTPEPKTPPAAPIIVRQRPARVLETVLLASTAALLAAVAWPIARDGFSGSGEESPAEVDPETAVAAPLPAGDATIQIALLLDTSGSMDGLLDQARSQLWRVVNALDSTTFQDQRPRLEIAVYEYGNDRLEASGGHIRQVSPFSTELDLVSQALFSLTTDGGDEFAGQVIGKAVDDLKWRDGDNVLRVLYIAGNEGFNQGPVDYREAIAAARDKGIVVNTVNCLGRGAVPDFGWAEGASVGGGKFLRIDHNAVATYVAAPQDDEIARLGNLINGTYIRYGKRGAAGMDNLAEQDNNSAKSGKTSQVARALSKSSGYYRNSGWDLVDALEDGKIDLEGVDRDTLAIELKSLSQEELSQHVEGKQKERKQLQERLGELKTEREEFVAAARAGNGADGGDRLDDAIIGSIVEQATAAGFNLNRS